MFFSYFTFMELLPFGNKLFKYNFFFFSQGSSAPFSPQNCVYLAHQKFSKVRWCFPLATLTRGQPFGPPRDGLAQVLGLLELHPVQRTSSDEPHFFISSIGTSVQKTNKQKHFKSYGLCLNGQVAQPGQVFHANFVENTY